MRIRTTSFLILAIAIALLPLPLPVAAHGDVHRKIAKITQQLKQQPDQVDLLLERANLYRDHGNYASANKDLATVKKIAPSNLTRIFLQSKCHADQKQWKEALLSMDAYLEKETNHTKAYHLRAVIYRQLNQPANAAKDLQTAIQLHQSAPASWSVMLADELMKAAQSKEALIYLDKALTNHPRVIGLHTARAKALESQHQATEAAAVYQSLRTIYPSLSLEWWDAEAQIWQRAKALEKERNALTNALKVWHNLSAKKKNIDTNINIKRRVKLRLENL